MWPISNGIPIEGFQMLNIRLCPNFTQKIISKVQGVKIEILPNIF